MGVAELDGIQDLEEDTFDQGIISNEVALFGDVGEQVTFRAELDHHVCTIDGIHNPDQRDHVGVAASGVVELNFPLLKLELAGIQPNLVEGLDGIHDVGVDVDGRIDDAIGAYSEDGGQLQAVGQEESQTVFRGIATRQGDGGRGRGGGKHGGIHAKGRRMHNFERRKEKGTRWDKNN